MKWLWLILISSQCHAQLDKGLHFIAGGVVATIPVKPVYRVALGVSAGIAKELFDYKYGGNVEMNDFIATAVGTIITTFIIIKIKHSRFPLLCRHRRF